MNKEVKQVIIIRRDLKLRRGKEMAQAAHASIEAMLNNAKWEKTQIIIPIDNELETWLDMKNNFRKIVCYVESEKELLDLYHKAKESGLKNSLVKDLGLTELKEPTYTCVAIGPNYSDEIDLITSHLKLY